MFNDKVVEDKKVVKKSALRFFDVGIFLRYEPRKLTVPCENTVKLPYIGMFMFLAKFGVL